MWASGLSLGLTQRFILALKSAYNSPIAGHVWAAVIHYLAQYRQVEFHLVFNLT